MVRLVYKMLKSKELGISIEDIKVLNCPREERDAEVEGESETECEGKGHSSPRPSPPNYLILRVPLLVVLLSMLRRFTRI